jgi:hypothetical protein
MTYFRCHVAFLRCRGVKRHQTQKRSTYLDSAANLAIKNTRGEKIPRFAQPYLYICHMVPNEYERMCYVLMVFLKMSKFV